MHEEEELDHDAAPSRTDPEQPSAVADFFSDETQDETEDETEHEVEAADPQLHEALATDAAEADEASLESIPEEDQLVPRGVVAIVGRPNVGKSSLFNRLIEARQAIVEDMPGVTRDRLYGTAQWNGIAFTVVDTGGYQAEAEDVFAKAIKAQVEVALQEADLVLFLVDGTEGVHPLDEDLAHVLRRQGKGNVLLGVNKVDTPKHLGLIAEFYGLGLSDTFPLSAMTGHSLGDLLDVVVQRLEALPEQTPTLPLPRLAVVGQPNVGKSSFVNALLGRDEHIVTEIAGTTRDALLTRFTSFGHDLYLVDTAGLRRKAKVHENVEFYSVMRTLRAIENCDIALLLVDATAGLEAQDLKIFSVIERQSKGVVLVVNKWDLVEKHKRVDRDVRNALLERLAPRRDVPILFTTATERKGVLKVLERVATMFEERERRIPTRKLNDYLLPILEQTPPPTHRGRAVRIKFVQQANAKTPTFLFFTNHPKHVKASYQRFLENQLRKAYGFEGWPVNVFFRQS